MSLQVFYPKNLFKKLEFCFSFDIQINNKCYLKVKLKKEKEKEKNYHKEFLSI